MKCREVKEQFADFLDDNLSEERRRRVKIHLKGCKKCQGEVNRLKKEENLPTVAQEKADQQSEPVLSSVSAPSSGPDLLPPAGALPKVSSSFHYMPAVGVVTILFFLGGMAYFLSQGSTEPKAIPSIEAASPSSPPSPEVASNRPPDSGPEVTAPPSAPIVPEAAPKIERAGNGRPHDLLKGSRRKPALKGPPVRVLLISRDLKEAVQEIESRAVESEGKILKKREGELTALFTLSIPAPRYETFFQSLQQLGLAKVTSKKSPPAAGPVTLELTIE
ncbi:MAG TPA: zf-HC2 domain-containing protein [Candidatus Manganitrophaceae bacterium]|nr:zf-HC2 domain-containing protein [Candidatus Manganitrophaceae bacterium]